jgi:hypothetical protein
VRAIAAGEGPAGEGVASSVEAMGQSVGKRETCGCGNRANGTA